MIKPYYEEPSGVIYLGDCLEMMREIFKSDKKIFDIIPPKRLHNLQEEAEPEGLKKVVIKEPENFC